MTAGIAVGAAVGLVYAVWLRLNLSRVPAHPDRRAVRLVQFGALMRLLFVVAAFRLAGEVIPGLRFDWALAAALAAVAAVFVRRARSGVQA